MSQSEERVLLAFRRGGLVKICGLREPEDAAAAAGAGANLLGFIFAPARRQVTAESARACIAAARSAAPDRDIVAVGVFVDAPLDEIAKTAEHAGLDALQLHGSEPPAFLSGLDLPVIKVFRPQANATASGVLAEMAAYQSSRPTPAGYLIEGYSATAAGGSGTRADWQLVSEISSKLPVLLSGGLDPDSVAEAIRQVRPVGVDVSSGVEVAGQKAPDRIVAFIREATAAFAALR